MTVKRSRYAIKLSNLSANEGVQNVYRTDRQIVCLIMLKSSVIYFEEKIFKLKLFIHKGAKEIAK